MLKNTKFSKKEKFEVLWDCGIKRIKSLCKLSGASRAQAYRYIDQLETVGHLERKGKSGGHNKIARKVETRLLRKMKDAKKPFSMRDMASHTKVSKSTAWRVAKANNYT